MTNRERIVSVLNFEPVDRMPVIELMVWWDKTLERWQQEGLPVTPWPHHGVGAYWRLDDLRQIWVGSEDMELRRHRLPEGGAFIRNEQDYERILPCLYPEDAVLDNWVEDALLDMRKEHESGDAAVWMSIYGYFWWPRVLFGIEPHLFAFYDYPELYHRICTDQMAYQLRIIEEFCSIVTPDFMTIAEDMSYNHGPMLSRSMFDEFVRPYYEKIIPALHQHGIKVLIDTDGDVTPMVPWLLDSGVDGILPLECKAGVDANILREKHPGLIMIGGFDKTVMHRGEAAMRDEFERLAPAMKSGGFIPCVDHQTPPDVSLENYGIYRKLLGETCDRYHP